MAGPYSQHLRDQVIQAVIHGGMSRRGAAEHFGVSESAAISGFSVSSVRVTRGRKDGRPQARQARCAS